MLDAPQVSHKTSHSSDITEFYSNRISHKKQNKNNQIFHRLIKANIYKSSSTYFNRAMIYDYPNTTRILWTPPLSCFFEKSIASIKYIELVIIKIFIFDHQYTFVSKIQIQKWYLEMKFGKSNIYGN